MKSIMIMRHRPLMLSVASSLGHSHFFDVYFFNDTRMGATLKGWVAITICSPRVEDLVDSTGSPVPTFKVDCEAAAA